MCDSVLDRLNLPGDSLPVEVVLILVDMRLAYAGVHRDKQECSQKTERESCYGRFGEQLMDVRKFETWNVTELVRY